MLLLTECIGPWDGVLGAGPRHGVRWGAACPLSWSKFSPTVTGTTGVGLPYGKIEVLPLRMLVLQHCERNTDYTHLVRRSQKLNQLLEGCLVSASGCDWHLMCLDTSVVPSPQGLNL